MDEILQQDRDHLKFLEAALAEGIHDPVDRAGMQQQRDYLKANIAKNEAFAASQEKLLRVTGPLPSELGERPEDA